MRPFVVFVVLLCVAGCQGKAAVLTSNDLVGIWEGDTTAGKARLTFTPDGKLVADQIGGDQRQDATWHFISSDQTSMDIHIGPTRHTLTFDGPRRFSMKAKDGALTAFLKTN